jgi:hypothetical protein
LGTEWFKWSLASRKGSLKVEVKDPFQNIFKDHRDLSIVNQLSINWNFPKKFTVEEGLKVAKQLNLT